MAEDTTTELRQKAIDILKKNQVLPHDYDPEKPFQMNLSRDGYKGTIEAIIQSMMDFQKSFGK